MVKELQYPFDSAHILKKKRSIRTAILSQNKPFLEKRIAILGGSTTHEIREILELFLLDQQIQPVFYESDYAQYWQEAMFGEALNDFHPDVIYIHTTARNIAEYPRVSQNTAEIEEMLDKQIKHFTDMWEKLIATHQCLIIQNNFERPSYRLLGNKDISDMHGRSNYILRLNQAFYAYAETHAGFFINDIDYLSASYGLHQWADPFYWYTYKYALSLPAIPELACNISHIICSAFGKNRKAIVLDLDNTLWGGVVGDDGVEGIQIGPEYPLGQVYVDFQAYLKDHQELGVLLAVCSKNEEENALAGLRHRDGVLRPDDFLVIKANWESKDRNIADIASELNLGADSFVFVDDNPAERAIVAAQIPGIAVPNMGDAPERYISILDRSGYFEATHLSKDDLKRNEMYRANAERSRGEAAFANYEEYLQSLQMTAAIQGFQPMDIPRIAQLINKSNQFNLTTRRYSEADIERMAHDANYIGLCGRLADCFGDNGIVSVVIGEIKGQRLHIDEWLMSCRVLKRNMEFAMFDALVQACKQRQAGIQVIVGYYILTPKNKMVHDFYGLLGFDKIQEDEAGNSVWEYSIAQHQPKNQVIRVNA